MLNSAELVDKNIILLHLGHMMCILIYNLANTLPGRQQKHTTLQENVKECPQLPLFNFFKLHRINDIHSVAFNS